MVGEAGRIGGYVGRRGEEGMQSGKQDGGRGYYAILYLLWPAIIHKRTSCQEERPRLTHQLTRLFKCYSRKVMTFLLQVKVCLIIRWAFLVEHDISGNLRLTLFPHSRQWMMKSERTLTSTGTG